MNKTKVALMITAIFAAGSLNATSVGNIIVNSAIGQPLNADIALTIDKKEDVKVRIAPADIHRQYGIPYSGTGIEAKLTKDGKYIRLSSHRAINDAALNILVEV